MNYAYQSDKGQVRPSNQDYVGIFKNQNDTILAIVADGVGGNRGGDVASEMAVSHIGYLFESSKISDIETAKNWLTRQISAENKKIVAASQNYTDLNGMGTTIVAAMFIEHTLVVTNLGDSRCYLLADDQLKQVSVDHSLVNDLVKKGEITASEAAIHPQKNIITKSLGMNKPLQIDFAEYALNLGDQVLLCTDGLSNQVSDETIKNVLSSTIPLEDKCGQLVKLANEAGGPDNITALIVENDQRGDHNYDA